MRSPSARLSRLVAVRGFADIAEGGCISISKQTHVPRVLSAERQMRHWVGRWWRQPDNYEQLSSHLKARGMDAHIRVRISIIAASLSISAVSSIWSPAGPRGIIEITLAAVAGVGAAAGSLLWVLCWPTRRQAVVFAVASTTSIALAALAQSNPAAGMLSCTAFAVIAIHLGLFHAAPMLAYNIGCAALVAGIQAGRLVAPFGLGSALCAYWVVLLLSLAGSLGLHAVSQALGVDAVRADRDSLTSLFNRRAFFLHASRCLDDHRDHKVDLVIAVIDLDRFKQLNDRYGHAVGDEALVAVAQTLQHNAGETAVVGRIGGEEFAVADTWQALEVGPRAQRLCNAIAALPFGITGSVGTVSLKSPHATAMNITESVIGDLMAMADAAMYVAKRRGGNQASHQSIYPQVSRSQAISAK